MEEEKKEVLVIKSDKEWLQYFRIRVNGVILFILMEIVVEVVFNYDLWKSRAITHEIAVTLEKCVALMFIIANIFLVLNIYRIWRNKGRKLVLDKTGIWTKICFYEKKYEWKDFKIRQLRKNLGEFCYDEGVFFAVYKRQPRQNSNCEFFPIRYPMGGFNINFKMHRPILVTSRNYTIYINGEIMAVEKEELLSKLKEWGVDFETERPKNFDIFQDKKGRLQSRRNGTAWILLAAAIWLLLLGFIIYPIFIWKNPVLIAIFIPFFIALVPVYVVVTSRKSYRLKMDEKGCIRTFLFLSKRYLWKDLRVKLIASEESHCGEGVLFIKKKSGNSSSASETFSYASLHPYSSFVANFEVFGKMYGEKDALHEINKELFLEKMKEWGVEVEGLPKEE